MREAGDEQGADVRLFYLESSALVAGLIEHDRDVIATLDPARTVMSALSAAEARRALHRAIHTERINRRQADEAFALIETLEAHCRILAVTDEVLTRVGRRFPVEPVRTLDAIHLASAELLDSPGAPVTVLSRDQRVLDNALAMGLRVA